MRVRLLLLATVAALPATVSCGGLRHDPAPRGIVLIVLDTLRADRLSAYGNPRHTSPRIDAFAAEGVLFESAIGNASWTLPAFVGLLSGSYPSARVFQGSRLSRSLVEDLHGAGYTTAAFTEGAWVSPFYGIDRGFDSFSADNEEAFFDPKGRKGEGGRRIEKTFGAASAWLRQHKGERFFLLVHTYEVHMPYLRREFARELPRGEMPDAYTLQAMREVAEGRIRVGPPEIDYVRALYDGGVAAADREVGKLLDLLGELGIAGDTLVVLTADHGEELGERDPKYLGVHGFTLYDTVLHVPLILRFPARRFAARRVAAQVRSIDTLPTILDLAGIPAPADAEGRSLVPMLEDGASTGRPAYAELLHTDADPPLVRRVALRDGGFKLIVNAPPLQAGEAAVELYDVAVDPAEQHDLARDDAAHRDALAAELRSQREAIEHTGHAAFSEHRVPGLVQERLRALGYVQ